MPFLNAGLYIDRGTQNGSKTPEQLGDHNYKSSEDTLSQISTISFDHPYFPAFFNAQHDEVFVGDLILVDAVDGFARYKIIALDPVAIVRDEDVNPDPIFNNVTVNTLTFAQTSTPPGPTPINFGSERVIVPLEFTGAFGTAVITNAIVSRIGSMLIMNVPTFVGLSAHEQILVATIPFWMRLTADAPAQATGYTDGYLDNEFSPFMGKAIISPESSLLTIMKLDGDPIGNFPITGENLTVRDFTICYCVD